MKTRILSDLHFEIHEDNGKEFVESLEPSTSPDDLLILAGDITTQPAGIPGAMELFCKKFPNVVYVLGNHEYWRSDRGAVHIAVRKACSKNSNLRVLENTSVPAPSESVSANILGTTLWFPQTVEAELLQNHWSDFLVIRGFHKWVYEENKKAVEFLKQEVKEGDIVVTHHLPSFESIHNKFKNERANCFFVCNLEEFILERKPALWVHGHTHMSMDYMIGKTRVVCNPFGYVGHELNPDFNSQLEINL